MKLMHLETVTFNLRVLTPVHIGDGNSLLGCEYLFNLRDGSLSIFDLDEFMNLVAENNLIDSYEAFILSRNTNLYGWLHDNNFARKAQAAIRYSIKLQSPNLRFRPRDLHLFLKGPDGYPYLPGSSIKGALRTALAACKAMDGVGRGAMNEGEVLRGKTPARPVEDAMFNVLGLNTQKPQDKVNDILRGIRVADSDPLPFEALTLCSKIDQSSSGEQNAIPLLRESIIPGTVIPVTITFDENVLRGSGINAAFVLRALERFYENTRESFGSKFTDLPEDPEIVNGGAHMFLGGGAGFVTKTFTYPLFGEEGLHVVSRILEQKFPRHAHNVDPEIGVSPRMAKLTKYGNDFLQMGLCELSLAQ